MNVLREIFVRLGLDVDEQSFAKGQLAAHAIEKGIEKLVEAGKEFIENIVEQAKEVVEYGDKVNKAAQSIGIARGALQELQYVGQLADVGTQEMAQSIGLLSRNMFAAAKGGEEQAKVFAQLGVHVKGADGKLRNADEVIGDIAEKFEKMPDGVEKTATALQLFGRAGKQMIPFLNQGRGGIAALRQEARDLGLVLDDETVKASEELNDNFTRLKMVTLGLWRQAIGPLIPVFNKLVEKFLAWRRQRAHETADKIRVAVKILTGVINGLGVAFDLVTKNMDVIKVGAIGLIATFALLNAASVGAAVASTAAWIAAAAPFIAIGAAIAGILLFFDDIRVFKSGKGHSLIGIWADTIAEWQKPNPNDPWWLKAIKQLVEYLEKALGIYNKMHHIFEPEEDPNKRSPTGASVKLPFTSGPAMPVPKPYISGDPSVKNGDPGTWLYGYRRARAAGHGIFASATTRNAEFAEAPSLPPGAGVTRAPVQQLNQRTYNIYQSPGMSSDDVYNIIQSHEDAANEAAAAQLGP